ncbi:PREDICTED: uncharacterized protein LOC105958428 [Erythranthe guttata]|uniref:uncharacterized protein LOC105958428 n=1 Tax=Erythranthe guttata TaxID=4155 RepID=UPI00064DED22|nr:PREDICTED: uncharacterized protein LOC105958428 [Erythranthe guttata]|eukprot:XP_012837890.1 PREDICTED: uncharacterized protein LOC105958428 [Erythranthe guttata]
MEKLLLETREVEKDSTPIVYATKKQAQRRRLPRSPADTNELSILELSRVGGALDNSLIQRYPPNSPPLSDIVGDDFNDTLSASEKDGGNPRPLSMILSFIEALQDCKLTDLGYSRSIYTWSNKRETPLTVRCRLDRVCGNDNWRSLFPQAQVQHLEFGGSDHVPILLTLKTRDTTKRERRRRPFQFEAMWIRHEDCVDIIHEQWSEQTETDPIEDLLTKTESCRAALMRWSWVGIHNPRKRIAHMQQRLHLLNMTRSSTDEIRERRELQMELEHAYQDLDTYWKQRSRVQWMREGDRNTGFFHAKAINRKRTNWVHKLKDDSGEWK